MQTFSERVLDIVKQIPEGRVATYGQIARIIGAPRSARYVGYALRTNKEPVTTPCHRVLFKDGRICEGYAFGGPDAQRKLLEDEGVEFVDDMHVDLTSCAWAPDLDHLSKPSDIDWEKELGF